jgi:hypothetical protein
VRRSPRSRSRTSLTGDPDGRPQTAVHGGRLQQGGADPRAAQSSELGGGALRRSTIGPPRARLRARGGDDHIHEEFAIMAPTPRVAALVVGAR